MGASRRDNSPGMGNSEQAALSQLKRNYSGEGGWGGWDSFNARVPSRERKCMQRPRGQWRAGSTTRTKVSKSTEHRVWGLRKETGVEQKRKEEAILKMSFKPWERG